MSSPAPRIERFVHRHLETVRSADLRDEELVGEELWAWHNRALHGAYGVSTGLEVGAERVGPDPGKPDVKVWVTRVKAGLGYDQRGQPVALAADTRLPVPFDPLGLTLVARRGEDGGELAWLPTNEFRFADGIAIAKTVPVTLAKIPNKDVTLKPDAKIPPELSTKVTHDPVAGFKVLRIRGLLSPDEFAALSTRVEGESLAALRAAYDAWPFDAPLPPSGRIGLVLSFAWVPVPGADPDRRTLWVAKLTAGTARNRNGQEVGLANDTEFGLNGEAGATSLVLTAGGAIELRPDPPGLDDPAALLETIAPPAVTLRIPGGLRSGAAPIKATLDALRAAKKIDDQGADPEAVTVTGFLTWKERDDLVNAIAAVNTAAVPAVHALLPARTRPDPAARPTVGPPPDPQRPPFFPLRSRPLARPRSAAGASIAGRTEWKRVTVAGIEMYAASLNYEAAGFTDIPQVFAWLDRIPDPKSETKGRPLFRGEVDDADPLSAVSVKGFRFLVWPVRVSAPAGWFEPPPGMPVQDYLREHVYVRWVAFQSDAALGGEQA